MCLAGLGAGDTPVKMQFLSLGSCHATEGRRKVDMYKLHRVQWAYCLTFRNLSFLIHKMRLRHLLHRVTMRFKYVQHESHCPVLGHSLLQPAGISSRGGKMGTESG